ncbi:MAG: hypothetical protein ACREDT_11310 [Methylocella sp.]
MREAIAPRHWPSRANKAAVWSNSFFVALFAAAGATLLCPGGGAAQAIGETSRADLLALPAPRGMKIDTAESALDLKRTEVLLATFLCPIADYLEAIRETPMTPHERFLIVWAKDREEYYVQCLFIDNDKQILCEGASGYYYDAIKGFATAVKREDLAELGFSTDASEGNFQRMLRLDDRGTRPVAKLIIETLARVYELGPSDKLEYTAPLLSGKKGNPVIADPERCPVPTSSLRRALAASTILARHP